jgi:ABC-2 type transport system ATP-binding protein
MLEYTATSTPIILKLQGLSKQFGQQLAVNNIDLTLHKGQVLGLLGPNGSGKTTTLRMALGLITPTSGSVELFGQTLARAWQQQNTLRRIGSVIEMPQFYPYLNAQDNLRVVARLSGWTDARHSDRRITQVLEHVDLARHGRISFKRFSLGMKQRLALGAALLTAPELLVLDEPTNGLDPEGIQDMRKLITSLAEQGTTLIVSSHLGNMLAQGDVQELLQQRSFLFLTFASSEIRDKAQHVLQQAQTQETPWLLKISPVEAKAPEAALRLDAAHSHAVDILTLLARHELWPVELRREHHDLEQFFFALTQQDTAFPAVIH